MDAVDLRARIGRLLHTSTLKKRQHSLEMARAKAAREQEDAAISLMLDDVAAMLDKPQDDPQVLAITALMLARQDRERDREIQRLNDGDLGYPGFNW
jgi:hypothetical protein